MLVEQFITEGIAHSSYLLGGTRTCAIVDPRRDVDDYEQAAKSLGLRLTHVLQTHLHADFVSGHLELFSRFGATIYAPTKAACAFTHQGVCEGDEIKIDHLRIRVAETPGHTPEHVSYVVTDPHRGPEPVCVFCGDTLLVGDVGRPDLFPGRAKTLAASLYESLHGKLLQLPDFCEVYPAHGAGSLCGRTIGAKKTSTIGYERRFNPALQATGREDFVRSLVENMPPAPSHFSRLTRVNRDGPALIADLPKPRRLEPDRFHRALQNEETVVVDTRGYGAFGGYHIPGSYNIDLNGSFAPVLAGWILPPKRRVLLVSHEEKSVNRALLVLHRVGLDNAIGYLGGGALAWAKMGYPLEHTPQLSPHELHQMRTTGTKMLVVDVRSAEKYAQAHIQGAVNMPFPILPERQRELEDNTLTVLVCGSGYRSSLTASLLKRRGFRNVAHVVGGMTACMAAGL